MLSGVNLENEKSEGITVKKSENFSEWYSQVLTKSEFIDYGIVSGTVVFKPSSYFAWQKIVEFVNNEFVKDGVENVYFSMLIPESLLEREKTHFKGFNPEVAWVTEAGKSKLKERLAVRPTSETIMYPSFAKWIRSWRDLPMRYNQWNNVIRWEFKNPTPLIRTREFLWNEGHTVYASKEEAENERDFVLGVYQKALAELAALKGVVGRKTENERFAGAVNSYSIELLLPDGWALQGPDFHNDGQNFSKAFDVKFLNREGKYEYAWQNTYAISTRVLGAMVAVHGDDKGLVLPPNLAYIQVVIVPIMKKGSERTVLEFSQQIYSELKTKYRTKLDDRDYYSPGYKYNEWELKGVPIRIEIGAKEAEGRFVTAVRRDNGVKSKIEASKVKEDIGKAMEQMQKDMLERAEKLLKNNMHEVKSYEKFKEILKEKKGILVAPWCGESECELKIKEETGAKILNVPLDQMSLDDKCIYCGKKAKYVANFARSY